MSPWWFRTQDYEQLFQGLKHAMASEPPPTRVEVYAMAKYLGVVPEREGRLMWIAKQAVIAPLPTGWAEVDDDSGPYYFDTATGEAR